MESAGHCSINRFQPKPAISRQPPDLRKNHDASSVFWLTADRCQLSALPRKTGRAHWPSERRDIWYIQRRRRMGQTHTTTTARRNRALGQRAPVTPRRLPQVALLLCVAAFVAACGSDDHRATAATPTPTPAAQTASITVVHSPQARQPLPHDVTRFRFTGWDTFGAVQYGPRDVARAETVELDGVPRATTTLQIEYLNATDAPPVAVFRTSVDVLQGDASIVDPAFVDTADATVFSFVSFGCNRVASDALASNSPSSANIGQLVQDFGEIVDAAHVSPVPDYVFFTGDLVLNFASGTATLASQLQAWISLYESTPLGDSSIPLIAAAGNHEMLVQITVTVTPGPTPTPGGDADSDSGAEVKIEIPNPPTGVAFSTAMAAYIPAANGPTEAPPNLDLVERDESRLSFSFRDGATLFIVVNTDTYVGGDTPAATGMVPLNWVDEQLAAANGDPSIENIFVFGHRPISSPDPDDAGIATSQALAFYELLSAPTTDRAPSKVRAYICAHAHLWNQSVPAIAPPGSTLVQVIAGNGGSPTASTFISPYYGYSVFALTQSGAVTVQSWGRPVPTPYAAPPPQPTSSLREQLTIYLPPAA